MYLYLYIFGCHTPFTASTFLVRTRHWTKGSAGFCSCLDRVGEYVSGLGAVELGDGGVGVGLDRQRLALPAHEAVDLVAHAHAQLLRPTQCNMQGAQGGL